MLRIILTHQNATPWVEQAGISVKGFILAADGSLLKEQNLAAYFGQCRNESELKALLRESNGMFSVVIKRDHGWIAAVDRARSFPLFYRKTKEGWDVSEEVDALFSPGESKMINQKSACVFRFTGYTISNTTLLEGVYQVQPGEMVCRGDEQSENLFYFRFAKKETTVSYEEAKQQLSDILQRVGKRLVTSLEGRPVAVPLSGGLDSRLIVYLLHQQQYKNVTCFTYGKRQHNHELSRSQRVAEHFGYPWLLVDYQQLGQCNLSKDSDFQSYSHYAFQYSAKCYLSEYLAAVYLRNQQILSHDTVVLPGHSGDTIGGSHVRPYMLNYRSDKQVIKDLIYNHFNLFETHGSDRCEITRQLNDLFRQSEYRDLSYAEKMKAWVLRERHGKYIVNSCRLWEYMGCSFLLPLWDSELVDFFAALPIKFRLHKKLYEEVLWELFEKEGILYEEDRKSVIADGVKERLKLFVKRNMMFIQPRKELFANDPIGFQYLLQGFQQELSQKPSKWKAKSFNAFLTEWYLSHLEQEVTAQK